MKNYEEVVSESETDETEEKEEGDIAETSETVENEEVNEELVEQDISLVTGLDYVANEQLSNSGDDESIANLSTSSSSQSSREKIVLKGREYFEEPTEFDGKELVILKANTGFLLLFDNPTTEFHLFNQI